MIIDPQFWAGLFIGGVVWVPFNYFIGWCVRKNRADHYEPFLKINGSFADVIKVSVTNPDKPKEQAVKKKK